MYNSFNLQNHTAYVLRSNCNGSYGGAAYTARLRLSQAPAPLRADDTLVKLASLHTFIRSDM